MNIKLIRSKESKDYTEGKLYINEVYFCDTLELKDRGLNQSMSNDIIKSIKVYAKTCIPYGIYKIIISMSNRFKKMMPEVLQVKGFEGIRIHSGNTTKDTEGCILVGEKCGEGVLKDSMKTFNALMRILTKDDTLKSFKIE